MPNMVHRSEVAVLVGADVTSAPTGIYPVTTLLRRYVTRFLHACDRQRM